MFNYSDLKRLQPQIFFFTTNILLMLNITCDYIWCVCIRNYRCKRHAKYLSKSTFNRHSYIIICVLSVTGNVDHRPFAACPSCQMLTSEETEPFLDPRLLIIIPKLCFISPSDIFILPLLLPISNTVKPLY